MRGVSLTSTTGWLHTGAMRLDPAETFAGVPARQVRDALRRCAHDDQVNPDWIAWAARCPEEKTEDFVDALIERGLIVRDARDEEWVEVTEEGLAFAQATLTTITRKTAQRVLGELLERVRDVNRDEDEPFQVTEIVVFGSYLTDVERLGDVDVAIEIVRVGPLPPGANVFAPHVPLWRRLQNRSRTLSLVHLGQHREWIADKPHQVVLTAPDVVERSEAYLRSLRASS